MADICPVCEKTMGLLSPRVTRDDMWLHFDCLGQFEENPEAYGGQAKRENPDHHVDTKDHDNSVTNSGEAAKVVVGGGTPPRKIPKNPGIIDLLIVVGWVLFIVTCIVALFAGSQLNAIIGFAVAFAGAVQLLTFLGFSAIIEQLYNINKNTFPQ